MAELNLQGLLDEGLTGSQFLQRLHQAATSEIASSDIWERLALLIRFDAKIYGAAMHNVAQAPSLDTLASSPDVRQLDGLSGMFAVTPARRKDLFDPHRVNFAKLRAFACDMRRTFDALGRAFELDAMAVALVGDPHGGTERFKKLYHAADAAFDIPRCAQLIEILRGRMPLVPGLLELTYEYDDYFRARTMFVEDFYRSASYLDRPGLRRAFEQFWKSPNKWMLRLYGKGGRGKTMFLRWLIARRCLPRGRRTAPIAVARVDFDELSLTAFDDHPWLLLLPMMRQLSPQLPNRPFQTLIRDLDAYSAYLRSAEHQREVSSELQAKETTTIEQFRAGLGTSQVLLIFDTCEEPLIHRRAAFLRLLETLADAQKHECPNLRLLLSGRYDLEAKGLNTFQHASARIEVTPFDDREAKAYLTKHRGMKPGSLVNAVIARSGGNPFNLGLFADLATSPEGLSLDEVLEAPRAEFIYLLDSVILRIPQEPVRWLVRYAAIPRELTLDFASKVIAPLLSGRNPDRPNQFGAEALAKRYALKQPWPQANLTNMDQVWQDLRAYASNPSWILWNDDTKSLKLQSEVVGPMRLLLQENRQLFDALQRRAEEYWRRRGRTNKGSYTSAVAEEFFHRFHRLGHAAGSAWRKTLDDPRLADTSDRLRLAEAVLDLLDERNVLRGNDPADLLVDPPTVLKARAEVAFAALAGRLKLGLTPNAEARTLVEKLTEQWLVIARTPPSQVRRVIPRGELALLRSAYMYLGRGLLQPLAPLRAARLSPRLRLLARMLAGRVSYERYFWSLPTDARDFEAALALSAKLRSKDFPAHHIFLRSGLLQFRTADLEGAIDAFRKAWRSTPWNATWEADASQAFWRLIAGLRMTGRWAEALGVLDAARSRTGLDERPLLFQVLHARAAILMDLGDLVGARQALDEAKAAARDQSVEPVWQELAAEIALRAYDIPAAEASIRIARNLYPQGGLGQLRADILEVVALTISGKRKTAQARLRRRPPVVWSLWFEYAEARIRAGNAVPPALISTARKPGATVTRARALATALAHGRIKDPTGLLNELDALDADARFAALVPFEETDRTMAYTPRRPRRASPRRGITLDRVLPAAPPNGSAVSFLQRLVLANTLRFFGRHQRALEILRETEASSEPTIEWRRLRALAAAGVFDASTPAVLAVMHDKVSTLPYCVAAACVEALEWALRHQQVAAAEQIGERASTMREVTARIGPEWVARLALAEGELLGLHGQWDEAASRLRTAQTTAKAASSTEIARRAATRLVTARKHAKSSAAPANITLVPSVDEWRFTRPSGDEILVQVRLASGAGLGFKHPHRVPAGLRSLLVPGADPVRAVRVLAELDQRFLKHLSAKSRLRLEPGPLSALPWEFYAPSNVELFYRSGLDDAALEETPRWMQLVLRASGHQVPLTSDVAHPIVQHALKEVNANSATPLHETLRTMALKVSRTKSPVLVSEPDAEWQYGNRRGYAPVNVNLASAYTEFFVETLANYSMTSSPSVVHLAGVFNDKVTGSQRIDLGPGVKQADRPSQWSAHDVASFFGGIPAHRVKPLVVLDALSTGSKVDAMQEGVRRNTLCAEIFQQGTARAVLGFGLAQKGRERDCLMLLVSAIRANVSIGLLHARLLAARDYFVFPPALWADDPHLPADIDL